MGDRTGLLVMLGIVILLVSILLVMRPRRHGGDDVEHETLNPEVESAEDGRQVAPPDTGRLVGNPPTDTLSASGDGTAVAGAGAGGWTPDARDPLRAPPNDVGNSPDQT